MSLDVYLEGPPQDVEVECGHCGHKRWTEEREEYHASNITHNLNTMAGEAGIYQHLWRPEELGITKSSELIEPLTAGLELLKSDPKRFEAFNSPNGWGLYKNFVPWVSEYLEACKQHPDATVRVSR